MCHPQVWILQAFCSRGTLLDAIERGLLCGADGRPNMFAILQTGVYGRAAKCFYVWLAC